VRDRSQERIKSHSEARVPQKTGARERGAAAGHEDIALWETALLAAEGGVPRLPEEDLTFQIDALQRSLQGKNVALEDQIVEASGALEGSLAAIRHLTHELRRLVDEASLQLRTEGDVERAASGEGASGRVAGQPAQPSTGQRSWRP
jgi:hypothetical protein